MRFFTTAASLLAVTSLASAGPVQPSASSKGYSVGTFYVNWAIYARQFFVTDLPQDKLTKVTYAFANINNVTGEVVLSDTYADLQFKYPTDVVPTPSNGTNGTNSTILYGNFNQLFKLKQNNRNLKVVLSVGGWSYRANFKPGLATAANRLRFAQSACKLIADLGLDGLDVDWEYVADATDAANMVATLTLLRKTFDEYSAKYAGGYHFLIDISAPAGPSHYTVTPINQMDQYVDQWKLMAFDYMGPAFSNFTGHLSNVYASKSNPRTTDFNTDQAVQYYKQNVASPEKIVLGLPLYGRSFANTDGMGMRFNGSGEGTWEAGVLDYKVLPLNGSTMYIDKQVVGAWSYDKKKRELVSFDTPEIQATKAKYLQQQGLGGAWWWDSSSDRTDDKSLVTTVYNTLGGASVLEQSQNCLTYPISIYDNIRSIS